jgi:hypothetical protein
MADDADAHHPHHCHWWIKRDRPGVAPRRTPHSCTTGVIRRVVVVTCSAIRPRPRHITNIYLPCRRAPHQKHKTTSDAAIERRSRQQVQTRRWDEVHELQRTVPLRMVWELERRDGRAATTVLGRRYWLQSMLIGGLSWDW